MRVWHVPARRLPVVTRPIAGETISSYARRLGAANDLPGTTMLRALGEFTGRSSGTHLLTGFEARLNEQAAARLEEYTGRPGDLLALILPGWTPLVCHRHRRWLGRDHETAQHDLSAAPDIIAASRRLAGILARSEDRAWAWKEFAHAWNLARHWPEAAVHHMPALARRWRDRAAAFGVPVFTAAKAGSIASAVVAFPEAVALTAVITDLSLRRHVAMEWDIKPFHQRVSASLGERAQPGWDYNDPAHRWARAHRHRFEALRYSSWRTPLLPAEHFK